MGYRYDVRIPRIFGFPESLQLNLALAEGPATDTVRTLLSFHNEENLTCHVRLAMNARPALSPNAEDKMCLHN